MIDLWIVSESSQRSKLFLDIIHRNSQALYKKRRETFGALDGEDSLSKQLRCYRSQRKSNEQC